MTTTTPAQIWTHITSVVTQLLAGRGEDPGILSRSTKINADLGLSSIEIIEVMVMLEDCLEHPLSFQDLAVRDGEYVDDLALGELQAFVCRTLDISDGPTVGTR